MDNNAQIVTGPQELQAAPQQGMALAVTPMEMLSMAVSKGASIEQLSKLMDLQERWQANEAKKAFIAALGAFKANPPVLVKNKKVSFQTGKGRTEYRHATLDSISDLIGAALASHNISHRWDVEQFDTGLIRVTCILTHTMGHAERVSMQCKADDSGSKNSIQAISSAVSYLQRYTLLAAVGQAPKDADDDGRAFEKGGDEIVPLPQAIEDQYIAEITDAGSKDKLAEVWKRAAKACHELQDSAAHARLKLAVSKQAEVIAKADAI